MLVTLHVGKRVAAVTVGVAVAALVAAGCSSDGSRTSSEGSTSVSGTSTSASGSTTAGATSGAQSAALSTTSSAVSEAASSITSAPASGSGSGGAVSTIAVEGYGGSRTDLPMLVATAKGFDKEHHLKVRIVPLKSGSLGAAAVVGGSLQIGAASVSHPISADASGGHLQIVAGFLPKNIYSMVAPAGSPASGKSNYKETMKALKGTTIGVSSIGGTTHIMARALLKGAGMPDTSVKFTAVGAVNTGYAAILQKRVSAYMGYAPLPAICEITKKCTVLVNLGAGDGPPQLNALNGVFQVYYANAEFIKSHTSEITNFVAMVSQSLKWIADPANLQDLTTIAQKNIKLGTDNSDQVVAEMVKKSASQFSDTVDRGAIGAWNKFLVSNDQIKKTVSVSTVVWKGAPGGAN